MKTFQMEEEKQVDRRKDGESDLHEDGTHKKITQAVLAMIKS